jgi:hypothetical protein
MSYTARKLCYSFVNYHTWQTYFEEQQTTKIFGKNILQSKLACWILHQLLLALVLHALW